MTTKEIMSDLPGAVAQVIADAERYKRERDEAVDRVKDLYRGDDGQAWKEARKFLEEIGETEFLARIEAEKSGVSHG